MEQREPDLIVMRPQIFIYRDGRATKDACWGIELGDYPDKDSYAAFANTIPDALRELAKVLDALDAIQLEKALGGARLE